MIPLELGALRVAIAHDQLATAGGGGGAEKFLSALKRHFPAAPVYTTVYNPDKMPSYFRDWDIRTSFIQNLPGAKTRYQLYLPLMPTAVEHLNFDDYDLVISGSHSVIKGLLTGPDTLHICYCHSPIRYAWDFYHRYLDLEELQPWQKSLIPWMMNYLRLWDQVSSNRVDEFIANSQHVRRRIQKYYRREATVIYPPVEVHRFTPNDTWEDFYLMVGRLVGYKRHDLAIQAFNRNGRPLIIIGDGPERTRLEQRAKSNIKFLGRQSDEVVTSHLQRCRGFIFPGEEDFGIAPVEAMACGRPVVAYARGGALETVIEGVTGVFFGEATAEALNTALFRLEQGSWHSEKIALHTMQFSEERFIQKMTNFIEAKLDQHRHGRSNNPLLELLK
ncbi:glycosyltransferase [Anthocerotibacter panamensis]|uniref:glycosyltransferase n=1 Tax=Anthocerotibacter panamensis TaxID=2857077 RepID=UPI001C404C79|nr:glycosyltransferase [Anthocerotibacter panamensis]